LNYTRIVCLFTNARANAYPHNSMLKNYIKYIFDCQLILKLNVYFFNLAFFINKSARINLRAETFLLFNFLF